jgi:hypothetical protein
VAGCCALLVAGKLQAATPSEQLLPSTTKGYVSVGDIERFRADWAKTQLGQLLADPIMQPFVEDFQKQQQGKFQTLGITWDDLSKVSSGEAALALVQPSATEAALVLIVDVTGRQNQTATLLDKIKTNLIKLNQAKAIQIDVAGSPVTSYAIPKTKEQPARTALFCVKQDRLIAADNLKVLRGVLGRFAAPADDSLSALPAFASVIARSQKAAGAQVPHLRWFVEPFGYVEASRVANPGAPRRRGNDMLKILKDVGFTAIKGAGGFLHLATEKFEMLHQTTVYAPPVKAGEDRYELAANMLDFPNGGDLKPQPWVPRNLATYTSFNFKPQKAFEALGPLFDAIYRDKGGFNDVIDSIEEDPYGAHIKIRDDLIDLLSGRATIAFDYLLPITPKSERMLVAVNTIDETKLAANIEKSMKTDPDAKLREYKGHVIWEITNADAEAATAVKKAKQKADKEDDEEDAREHMLPNSAITVAHGQLLVASHYDFLTKMLDALSEREQLVDSNEYRLVKTELDGLSAGKACAEAFSRTDEDFRAPYELIRTGRMPDAETMLGNLLNSVLGEGKEGVRRAQRIDGQRLPDYDAVRRYFGPAGMTAVSEDDGWFLTGFLLSKEPPTMPGEKSAEANGAPSTAPAAKGASAR